MKLGLLGRPSSPDAGVTDAMATGCLPRAEWTRLRFAAVRDLVEPKRNDRVLDLG